MNDAQIPDGAGRGTEGLAPAGGGDETADGAGLGQDLSRGAGRTPDRSYGDGSSQPEQADRPHAGGTGPSDAEGLAVSEPPLADDSGLPPEQAVEQVQHVVPSPEEAELARMKVAHLFEIMGVKRVVSIDDDYEGTLEEVLEMAAAVASTGTVTFADEFDVTVPEEVWRASITERWQELDNTEQHLLAARGRKQSGRSDPEDQPDASAIRPLLPADDIVEFLSYPPAAWATMEETIVADAQEHPTLVLFDREMGDRADEGLRLSEALFGKDEQGRIFVALLTRTVQKGEEHEAWTRFTQDFPKLNPERFVVLSKEHLGPHPETFPQAIKTVLMAQPAAVLRAEVRAAITDGAGRADQALESLSPEEFQQMIFGASMQEGVWEPESLLRVFQVLMRREVRTVLYGSVNLRDSAAAVRRLCAVDTPQAPNTPAAVLTQQEELYDLQEHLNPVHLPLELGDVFETSSGSQFVLVEQPCDLMVRSDGTRRPELYEALLLPLKREAPKPGLEHLAFELPFYYDDGASAWVALNRPVNVPIQALDLAVFQVNGVATYTRGAKRPDGLWPAWDRRFEITMTAFGRLQDAIDGIDALSRAKHITSSTRKQMIENVLRADKASGRKVRGSSENGGTIKYDVRRVRRVLPLRARSLLSRYSLHRARDAFDFALATSNDAGTDG